MYAPPPLVSFVLLRIHALYSSSSYTDSIFMSSIAPYFTGTHYISDHASQYTICMVLPRQDHKRGGILSIFNPLTGGSSVDEEKQPLSDTGKQVIALLKKRGFEMFAYNSYDKSSVVLLLRLPLRMLREFAEDSEFAMKVDPDRCRDMAERGDPEVGISRIILDVDDDEAIRQVRPLPFAGLEPVLTLGGEPLCRYFLQAMTHMIMNTIVITHTRLVLCPNLLCPPFLRIDGCCSP